MFVGIMICFAVLLILGVPISFVLAITTTVFIMITGLLPFESVPHKMWNSLDQFVYTAIPMFMLVGGLMNAIEITQRLTRLAGRCVAWLPGGLAHVVIVTCMVISGIGGSAVADAVAVGSVMIPAMRKEGYKNDFSAAIVAASAVMGPIIPPSNAMIIYSAILGMSVGALFCAGIVPGILIALSLMVVCYGMAMRGKIPRGVASSARKEPLKIFQDVFIPLALPVIMVGGVLAGIATATEVASITVLCAIFIGAVIYRNLTLKTFLGCVVQTIIPTAVVFFLIAASSVFGTLLTVLNLPQMVAAGILEMTQNRILVLILINVFLLFMGTIMDASANLLILAPILAPIAIGLGMHPLHFAIMFIVNTVIGLITPPVGSLLFTVCPIARVSMGEVVAKIWPFIIIEVAVLLLITYVPATVLWLPQLLGLA